MIDAQQLAALATTFPVIQSAPGEIRETLGHELDPSEQVRAVEAMHVGEEPGLLVGTSIRLLAVFFTKMLWMRTPTIQAFRYAHVNRVEVKGSDAYVHASASPRGDGDVYENTFRFASPQTAQQLREFLQACSHRMQDEGQDRAEAIAAARHTALHSFGPWLPGDGDVYAPAFGGVLMGMPAWPIREAFRALTTEHGTLVATDGLSDPFEAGAEIEELEGLHGHGLELWLESDERVSSAQVPSTRACAIVSHLSYQVAALVLMRSTLERHEVVSMEVYADEAGLEGDRRVSPEGTVGVLIGLIAPGRPNRISLPPSDVLYAGVKVLELAQLERIRAGGSSARNALVSELRRQPHFWVNRLA